MNLVLLLLSVWRRHRAWLCLPDQCHPHRPGVPAAGRVPAGPCFDARRVAQASSS